MPTLAHDLVGLSVAVIAAAGGDVSAFAAKAATSTIPIVFTSGADPIASGLVASFNRPGGNATGVAMLTSALVAKRLELLVNLVPAAVVVGALVNPNSSNAISDTRDAQSAARVLKRQLFVLTASTERDFETVFATLARSSSELIGIRPPHSFAYVDPRPSGP